MIGLIGRLLFGGVGRTLLTTTGLGWVANKLTGGAVVDNVVKPAFSKVTDTVKDTAGEAMSKFDIGEFAEKHWGKAGLAASVASVFSGVPVLRNLGLAVLLATAVYFAYKHFAGPTAEFNHESGADAMHRDTAPALQQHEELQPPTNE